MSPSESAPEGAGPDPDPTRPYAGFGGEVGRIFSTSEPDWPRPPTAPEGAPNIIVMLVDDLGFADVGCYGSEIATPEVDRLAAEGVRYTNFHVNPMCSPTRASLLTGLNHHLAGMGHVAHSDPGFPGYAHELRDNAVTMAELFRDNGWASLMVGKWHLCKEADLSEAGGRHSWPLQKGFDRYYGILDGFTNLHQPHRVYEDNHALDIDDYPEGYYFTDELTDRAIAMIRDHRASHPTKPFFMYFSHAAVHAPLHAKPTDLARHRGRYDEGWDRIRESRFARQKELGVVPDDAHLPARNTETGHEVRPWSDLSAMERETFARYQEIYAAMVDNVDQNLGRLRAALEELGEWENTVVVFTSDNGGSREGLHIGTSAYFRTLISQVMETDMEVVAVDHGRLDLMGGPQTLPHYPQGWAMASGTPFRLYKTNTHQGGHQVPFVIRWPGRIGDPGSIRIQYQHVTDLLPTLAELAGVEVPTARHGVPLPDPAGSSFVRTLADETAESTHPEQYYEMIGHRGYYRDGWSASTFHRPRTPFREDEWELHDLTTDPTETTDLAALHPERLAELREAWEKAAWANQVFPLDEGNLVKNLLAPPWADDIAVETVLRPGLPTLERARSTALISMRSFEVLLRLEHGPADRGTLVAHGDQGGGYALQLEDGRLRFVHNGYGDMTRVDCGPLEPGAHEIVLAVEAPGQLLWNARISVDGEPVAEADRLVMLLAMAPFQGIDVGIDRRSPVDWEVHERHGTFPYTGSIHTVTYRPGDPAPDAGPQWVDFLREAGTRYE